MWVRTFFVAVFGLIQRLFDLNILRFLPYYSETSGDFQCHQKDGGHSTISYQNSSMQGMSGGPIMVKGKIIGIHTAHKRGTIITDALSQWISEVMEGWFDKKDLSDEWDSDQEKEEENFDWLEGYLEAKGFRMLPTMTKDNGLISSISLFFE